VVAANPARATREADISVNGTVVHVRQEPAACTFLLAPATQQVEAAGATRTLSITAGSDCSWSAAADVPWLTITSNATGTANGTIGFTAKPNDGSARTGHINANGTIATIAQDGFSQSSCAYAIDPTVNPDVGVEGGTGTPIGVTTSPPCSWTASSNVPWITLTSGMAGIGSGKVAWSFLANNGVQRTGTITVAGLTFTATQAACRYALGGIGTNVGVAGGSGSVSVTANGPGCDWSVSKTAPWITITGGASGTGNGVVSFTANPNAGTARSGIITIAGQPYNLTQEACSYSISPAGETLPVAFGTGTAIAVTTAPSCSWTAVSHATWIAVAPGTAGTGSGTVGWSFQANTGGQRVGTITIADQTLTATQTGCTYVLSANGEVVPSSSSSNHTFTVTTNGLACQWTASTGRSWLHINAPASGSGNGTITFSVDANSSGAPRTAAIQIQTQTFFVDQP